MGSFNTTCFASQQTIAPGDPCLVLPIVQSASYHPVSVHTPAGIVPRYGVTSSTCYPNSFWTPAGPMLEATYNDYGRVLLTDTQANRFKLLHLVWGWSQDVAKVDQGENEYHDVPVDVHGFITTKTPTLHGLLTREGPATAQENDKLWEECVAVFDHVWLGHQKHRLFAVRRDAEPRALQFAILHADAAALLVEQVSAQENWDKQSLHPRELFRRALAEGRKAAQEHVQNCENKEIAAQLQAYFVSARAREVLDRVGNCTGVSYAIDNRALDHLLNKVLAEPTSEDACYEKAVSYLQLRYVMEGLMTHNLRISPLVYASQDYDNEVGRGYAEFIRQASDRVYQRRRQDD